MTFDFRAYLGMVMTEKKQVTVLGFLFSILIVEQNISIIQNTT